MKNTSILAIILAMTIIYSCSSGGSGANDLPQPPATAKAFQDKVKGKKYKVEKAGTHSMISTDKDITWLAPKEDDKFEKEIVDESKSLQMDFVNDTSITVIMKDKTYNGTYRVDTLTGEDEKPGIKLRVSYVDEEFKFGDGPASLVTYTYIVEGANEKNILLETPRSMNRRKIVVLMNKQ
jgi:hypothetical protein